MINTIGLICNFKGGKKPEEFNSSRLYRSVVLSKILKKYDHDLFIYSYRDINFFTQTVQGYFIFNNKFIPKIAPIPKVNYNFINRSLKLCNNSKISYSKFLNFSAANNIFLYNDYRLNGVIKDKYATYKYICTIDNSLHPLTELFSGSREQLTRFLNRSIKIFLKPRFGSGGQGIITVTIRRRSLLIFHHKQGNIDRFKCASVDEALTVIIRLTNKRSYIIQSGINTLSYKSRVFDLRVIMMNDGYQWHKIDMIRIGPQSSELANISQGGRGMKTSVFLEKMIGTKRMMDLDQLISVYSHKIASHLNRMYSGNIMEVAMDYIYDVDFGIYLCELNTRPYMTIVKKYDDIYNIKKEEHNEYNTYTYPHMLHIANFLLTKNKRLTNI